MTYTIAVDLDDTLSNTMQAFFGYYHRTVGGKHFKREEITHYHISQIQGVLLTDAQQAAMAHEIYMKHPELILPRSWSLDRIQQRKDLGHRLYVVTGRALFFQQTTKAWIEKYFPNVFEDVLMCNYFFNQPVEGPVTSKAEFCKQINATMMIDDDPNYAINTATHDIQTFLMDRPWNQAVDTKLFPSMTRVHDWEQIVI